MLSKVDTRPTATKDAVAIYKNTLGNANISLNGSSKRNKVNATDTPKMPDSEEISNDIDKTQHCCAYGGSIGCIRKIFSSEDNHGRCVIDFNEGIETVLRCRQLTYFRDAEGLDTFMQGEARVAQDMCGGREHRQRVQTRTSH